MKKTISIKRHHGQKLKLLAFFQAMVKTNETENVVFIDENFTTNFNIAQS